MNTLSKVARLSAAASLLTLAACGGGGGGGAPATNVVSTPTSSGTSSGGSGDTGGTTGGTTTGTSSGGNTASSGTTDTSSGGTSSGGTSSGGSTGGTGTGSTGGGTTGPFATFGNASSDINQFGGFTSGSAVSITASGTPTLTAPLPATKGSNPTASPSGFTQPLSTNPSFPLTQTVVQIDATGIRPANQVVVSGAPSPLAGGATLAVTNWNPGGTSTFTLSIPGLGLVGANAKTITSTSLLNGPSTFTGNAKQWRITTTNNSYAALGLWEQDASSPNTVFLGTFITGYETPVGSMPKSGTASYSATQNVAAIVATYQPDGQLARGSVLGDAAFTADFGTGSLTGTFTRNSIIFDNGKAVTLPWNDVSVSASIAANSNTFTGSAVAGNASATNAYTITPGTTGKFDGGFFGPNADVVAGVWSLTDSSHVVTGVATGRQH